MSISHETLCPKCGRVIYLDPAGTGLWHCGTCQYGWTEPELMKDMLSHHDPETCGCGENKGIDWTLMIIIIVLFIMSLILV